MVMQPRRPAPGRQHRAGAGDDHPSGRQRPPTSAGSATINQDSSCSPTRPVRRGRRHGRPPGRRGGVGHAPSRSSQAEATEPDAWTRSGSGVQRPTGPSSSRAGSDAELRGMGTTLCAVALVDAPTRATEIALGQRRRLPRLPVPRRRARSSSPRTTASSRTCVRDGQLTEDEAAVHPQRNIVTRALGIDLDVEVDRWPR